MSIKLLTILLFLIIISITFVNGTDECIFECSETSCTGNTLCEIGFYLLDSEYNIVLENGVSCINYNGISGTILSKETKYGYVDSDNYCIRYDGQKWIKSNRLTYDGFIIDGTDNSKIISCDTENGCTSSIGSTKKSLGYIDGIDNTKIITCNTENGCSSNTGNTTEGVVYIDGTNNNKIISCNTENGCISSTGSTTEGVGYIDGTDNTKIIICDSKSRCISRTGSIANSVGYIDGTDNTKIITCDSENGCSSNTGNTTEGFVYIDGTDN